MAITLPEGALMTLAVTGASDDIICIGGDISEEFTYNNDHDGDLLAFSDGTLLRVRFDNDGNWRITPLARGAAALIVEQTTADDGGTDKATIDGDVRWVVHGMSHAKRNG